MDRMISISEARANLGELVTEAAEREVYLLRHSKPAAVLVSVRAYERLLDRLEDLEDELSVLRAQISSDSVPFRVLTDA